jgi:hypothetical protein
MTPPLVIRITPDPAPEESPVRAILDGIGLTSTLPERLARDAAGQPYEPVQIDPHKELVAQLAYLLRREPFGGAEAQIHENGRQFRERALVQINRALAGAPMPTRPLLHELVREARTRKEQLDVRLHEVEAAYTLMQERLHRWQDQIGRRSGSLGGDLWRWLIGGQERLSLPEAAVLWNQREYQALERTACGAAVELAAWLVDIVSDLLIRLDDLLAMARALLAAAALQHERLRVAPPAFAPWTLRIEPRIVGEVLLARAVLDGLTAELLRTQTEASDTAALGDHIKVLARQAAARQLAGLGIVDLIELESSAHSGTSTEGGLALAEDALILIGQDMLEKLQRPTWRLARGARPRVETLQVTSDGAPVYSLDGLASAAYGESRDRIGFVQVQVGVAKDDLALFRDGDETFEAILQQRNLFVLDEMALAWERTHASEATERAAGPDAPHPTNGRPEEPIVA